MARIRRRQAAEHAADPNEYRCEVRLIEEEDGRFSVYAAELPGVASCGDSEEDALEQIKEAFIGVISEYRSSGEEIPWVNAELTKKLEEVRWVIVHV